jgi:hypothetical protein
VANGCRSQADAENQPETALSWGCDGREEEHRCDSESAAGSSDAGRAGRDEAGSSEAVGGYGPPKPPKPQETELGGDDPPPEAEELLDVIRQLLGFNRGGTFDAMPGEWSAYKRAKRLLARYSPDAEQTS